MSLNESTVEGAALTWFGELGYAVGHGPHLTPGEPAAERDWFDDMALIRRLRGAIGRRNPSIPDDARPVVSALANNADSCGKKVA